MQMEMQASQLKAFFLEQNVAQLIAKAKNSFKCMRKLLILNSYILETKLRIYLLLIDAVKL